MSAKGLAASLCLSASSTCFFFHSSYSFSCNLISERSSLLSSFLSFFAFSSLQLISSKAIYQQDYFICSQSRFFLLILLNIVLDYCSCCRKNSWFSRIFLRLSLIASFLLCNQSSRDASDSSLSVDSWASSWCYCSCFCFQRLSLRNELYCFIWLINLRCWVCESTPQGWVCQVLIYLFLFLLQSSEFLSAFYSLFRRFSSLYNSLYAFYDLSISSSIVFEFGEMKHIPVQMRVMTDERELSAHLSAYCRWGTGWSAMSCFRCRRVCYSGDKNSLSSSIVIIILMKNILCIGGSGQLGQHVVSALSKYHVFNVDFKPHQSAFQNILLQKNVSPLENNGTVIESVKKLHLKFNAILVTAGGWTGGSIKDDDYFEKVRIMNEVNLNPTLLAAHLATKYLSPGGLIMFTGASSVYKEPQPDMIGYALAKTGVHYVATALAERAQEFEARVLTILPQTIDTPDNRVAMPTADFSTWSKPSQISELVLSWIEGLNVPSNGSFIRLKVKNGNLQPQLV